jgi:hypothetical protein
MEHFRTLPPQVVDIACCCAVWSGSVHMPLTILGELRLPQVCNIHAIAMHTPMSPAKIRTL